MKSRKNSMQGDLFGNSEIYNLKSEIQDLDEAIAKALKADNYNKARELTEKQEFLIQKMVELGE